MRMRYIVCGLHGCATFFPHYLINGKIWKKKKAIDHKIYVSIFSATFVWKKDIFQSKKI